MTTSPDLGDAVDDTSATSHRRLALVPPPGGEGARQGRVWALPGGPACPGYARAVLRDALAELGADRTRVSEAQLMVSELATNAFQHAGEHGPHELWLYLADRPADGAPDRSARGATDSSVRGATAPPARGAAADPSVRGAAASSVRGAAEGAACVTEARCAIFDRLPCDLPGYSWTSGDCGRGLSIVRELSEGRWGMIRTTSRLGPPSQGKAVWFAVPL
ncbi:ATP-binding protein [Actinomadura gamaensis]|uniref:ATP-binding protein n=1 Tax=Actinomadura gamaensis TaxID=1763541 RepID=A0ABV9U4J2_9ACTN